MQHNGIQHNGTKLYASICDTQHNLTYQTKLCIECHYAKPRHAECRLSFIVLLSVTMLNVVKLNVVAPTKE